jgi:hypothetical protein
LIWVEGDDFALGFCRGVQGAIVPVFELEGLMAITLAETLELGVVRARTLRVPKGYTASRFDQTVFDRTDRLLARSALSRIFQAPDTWAGLQLLSRAGMLNDLLPEYDRMRTFRLNPSSGESTLLSHSELTVKKLPSYEDKILYWVAFLHDVGKLTCPKLWSRTGGWLYPQHPEFGAEALRTILPRFCFDAADIELACTLVLLHQATFKPDVRHPAARAKARQIVELPERTFDLLMTLHEADRLGRCAKFRPSQVEVWWAWRRKGWEKAEQLSLFAALG